MTRAMECFAEVTDDIRRAVRVAVGRKLDPEVLQIRAQIGLEQLLGESLEPMARP